MAIWRIERCKEELGFRSHASIYQQIKKGTWTNAVKIDVRSSGWPDHEVIAISKARASGANDEQLKQLVNRLHEKRVAELSKILEY